MKLPFEERVKGVVYGIAYGDALGATIEKLTYNEIKEQYGRVESIDVPWYKANWDEDSRNNRMRGFGIITDDTLMTLALMKVYVIEKRHIDAYDMANEFIKEIVFRPRYIPELRKNTLIIERLFYPEKYIFLRHTLANCEPRQGGIGNMVNCGAAMYISPIGIVNACNPKGAYDEAIAFAMAHQCSYGLEAAGVLAACIAKAFQPEVCVEDIINVALTYAKDGTYKAIEAITNIAKVLKSDKDNKDLVVEEFHKVISEFSPMGNHTNINIKNVGKPSNYYTPSRLFSIEELPIALGYIVLHDGKFHETINDGVNSGRDTDSIGVMIGAILGAMQGIEHIQTKDIATLERVNKQNLEKCAKEFSEVAKNIILQDVSEFNKRKVILEHLL